VTTAFDPDYAALLFSRQRTDPVFVLNRPQFRNAAVLVTGANFGCGSSRESAVWALAAFGFRVVVARSFADIFRENCVKNGVLPIVLASDDADVFEQAVVAADGATQVTVDLAAGRIDGPGEVSCRFEIAAAERDALLRGLDDIGLTLECDAAIAEWEARAQREYPWLQEVGR
jgi:3-isopropylmalate dehydratase small subunit